MTSFYDKEVLKEITRDLDNKKRLEKARKDAIYMKNEMEEFNLTLEDLEEGKRYIRFNFLPEYYINKRGDLMNSHVNNLAKTPIKKGDRFKEIKKEAEFEEVKCFRHKSESNKVVFMFKIPGDRWKEQDYKIENGKLLVRDK